MPYDSLHSYYVTLEQIQKYEMIHPQLNALRAEFGELKSKKPDTVANKAKLKMVNAVLNDALELLSDLPEAKYLSSIEEDDIPQFSDVALVLSQFNAAMERFRKLHTREGRWFTRPKESI